MVGLGRIAGRGADAAVGLGDQRLGRKSLVGRVAPELAPHAGVHRLGEGFGKPVGKRLDEDRGIVVVGALEAPGDRLVLDPGGDHEAADIVLAGRRNRRARHWAGRRAFRAAGARCRASRVRACASSSANSAMSSPSRAAGQKPTTALGANHFSAMIRFSIACASSNSVLAAAPCSGSSRIAG